MTLSIQQAVHASGDVHLFDSPFLRTPRESTPAPLPALAQPSGPTAPPLATLGHLQQLGSSFESAMASGDPSVLMASVASMLRRNQQQSGEAGVQNDQTARRAECGAQIAAYNRAQADQQSASVWNTIAKVGAYVGAGLAALVGVAGAVWTGGVSTLGGIALAAVLISAAATIGMNLAQDTGAMQGPPPRWMSIAVGIVGIIGAVASMGAGTAGVLGVIGNGVNALGQAANVAADVGIDWHLWPEPPPYFRLITAGVSMLGSATGAIGNLTQAGTAASAAVGAAARTMNSTAAAVHMVAGITRTAAAAGEGAAQVTQGIGTTGSAVCTDMADQARADATHHDNRARQLGMQLDDLLDALRQVMATFSRQMTRASDTGHELAAGRLAPLGNIRMA